MKQQDNHWLLLLNCSNPAVFYRTVIIEFDLLCIYPHSCLWVQIWDRLTFAAARRRGEEDLRLILIWNQSYKGASLFFFVLLRLVRGRLSACA